jgi:hypothetical protein
VAGWIGRNNPSTVLEVTGKRVLATAHNILEQVETSMVPAPVDNDTIERPSLVLARAANHPGITPQSAPGSELPAPEALAAQARWAGPVSAAGGVDLVQEPIWPQVATALERAANNGIDLTDDLPDLVNGPLVASLRLVHDADLNPTDGETEPAPANAGVRAQTLATIPSKTKSTSARSR